MLNLFKRNKKYSDISDIIKVVNTVENKQPSKVDKIAQMLLNYKYDNYSDDLGFCFYIEDVGETFSYNIYLKNDKITFDLMQQGEHTFTLQDCDVYNKLMQKYIHNKENKIEAHLDNIEDYLKYVTKGGR